MHRQCQHLKCLMCHLNKQLPKWQSLTHCIVVHLHWCLSSKILVMRLALYQTVVCMHSVVNL